MTHTPLSCDPYQSLLEVYDRMAAHKIRHLPVVDKGAVVGVVSAEDIETLHRAPHLRIEQATVADAMTPAPYVVSIFAPVEEVVRTMAAARYGSAVVVDSDKRLRGIFTTVDALRLLAALLARRHVSAHSHL